MKFETRYKICLWKSYFDKGIALTSYVKYMIAFVSIASLNVKLTLYLGIFYAIFCFFLGAWWYKKRWVFAEHEVENRFNLFQREMRKKIKSKRFK